MGLAAIAACACRAGPFSAISDSEKLTAVSSSAHNGYVRPRMADGSYRPETYAFGEGGILGVLTSSDPTFDEVGFLDIAHMLAGPLAGQNYLPTPGPNDTDLLIMVFWGTTTGGVNTADGYWRDQLNYANAKLLGFNAEGPFQDMTDPLADPGRAFFGISFNQYLRNQVHGDVMSAIEVNRYFVILRAFDFRAAWKHKETKLLWETRFSLSERRHDFGRDLPAMAQTASLYFGRDTYGLVLKPIPEGRVDVGEATILDEPSAGDVESSGDVASVTGDWKGTCLGFRPMVIHVRRGGESTLESPTQGVTRPAQVSVDGGDVTVRVPGWGVIFRGTIKGARLAGTLSQYGQSASLTLSREAGAIPGQPGDRRDAPGR